MMNLSLFCFSLFMFLGVCGMLGYVTSAYQRLLADHEKLKAEQKSDGDKAQNVT